MSDIKLFRTLGSTVTQIEGHSVALEKSLQMLIEKHLDVFLGIRFLATEYSTGKTHGGRIDTLGIDENGCPCIIEYKRSSNENVINQGLYYLDWLMDHKAEFQLLAHKMYGADVVSSIEWSMPRLLCIAGDFNKYDVHAVQQMNRNIELIRYIRFGADLLLLEPVNAVQGAAVEPIKPTGGTTKPKKDKTASDHLAAASQELSDLFHQLQDTCTNLGDDVEIKPLKRYFAFKRLKNFASVEIRPGINALVVFVKIDPDTVALREGFTRDVREIGHWGTGDLEITIRTPADLEQAVPLLRRSYDAS